MAIKYDPILGKLRESDAGSTLYITNGTAGIASIRMEAPTGELHDMPIDATGHWNGSAVAAGGSVFLEDGVSLRLTEGGDFRIQEG